MHLNARAKMSRTLNGELAFLSLFAVPVFCGGWGKKCRDDFCHRHPRARAGCDHVLEASKCTLFSPLFLRDCQLLMAQDMSQYSRRDAEFRMWPLFFRASRPTEPTSQAKRPNRKKSNFGFADKQD